MKLTKEDKIKITEKFLEWVANDYNLNLITVNSSVSKYFPFNIDVEDFTQENDNWIFKDKSKTIKIPIIIDTSNLQTKDIAIQKMIKKMIEKLKEQSLKQ